MSSIDTTHWGYKLGRFLGISFIGAIIYSLYGLIYWLVTGRMYFGPWEWGLCLVTAFYISLIHRVDKIRDENSKLRV